MPPDSRPTASPSSKPKAAVTPTTVASPLTATIDRQRNLRQRLLLQAAEELRAHRVADREQEQVEERPAQQVGQLRLRQDADDDAGNQGPDDGPEPDTFEMEAADDVPEQDAQEQAERREPVQKRTRQAAPIESAPQYSSKIRCTSVSGAFLEQRQPQQHARLLGVLVQRRHEAELVVVELDVAADPAGGDARCPHADDALCCA